MTKEQILTEVANSNWQPEFEFTDDLDAVVDSILKPQEDYFLGLHSKVKGIIQREILFRDSNETKNVGIRFADVCNWQKELFKYKNQIISEYYEELNENLSIDGAMRLSSKIRMIENLPNQHINLGLRTTNVKVGEWTPPAPMFLEDLKSKCFPISIENEGYNLKIAGDSHIGYPNDMLRWLTEWYKTFEVIHFFEDLNGRLGGIIINILSYILTGKYLIQK
jgi:hypothetical protein